MKTTQIEEFVLLEKAKAGNEEAMCEIVDQYKRVLFYLIKVYQSSYKYSDDVSELYQLSLIALVDAVKKYDSNFDCSFATFLQIVVTRNLHSYYRSLHRSKNKANLEAISLDQTVNETEDLYMIDILENPNKDYDPHYQFFKKEYEKEVAKALSVMNADENKIFYYWRDGYSYKEMGELLGVSPRRVGYIVGKLKKKLTALIDSE